MPNTQTVTGVLCGLFSYLFMYLFICERPNQTVIFSLAFTSLVIVLPSTSQNQGSSQAGQTPAEVSVFQSVGEDHHLLRSYMKCKLQGLHRTKELEALKLGSPKSASDQTMDPQATDNNLGKSESSDWNILSDFSSGICLKPPAWPQVGRRT